MLTQMKLGCRPTPKARLITVPRIANYMKLPFVADSCDYVQRMREPWGMLGNDRYGDCVLAAYAHYCQGASVNATGEARQFTDEQVLGWYSSVTGFDPDDPSTDNGTYPLDALQYLLRIGEIEAYGRVDIDSTAHVAAAIELFGGIYSAWHMPKAWQKSGQFGKRGPSLTGEWAPGSWGGHMMTQHGYDEQLNMPTVTWGSVRSIEADARVYCDEAYVIVTRDWLDSRGKTLQGFDLEGLKIRLTLVD